MVAIATFTANGDDSYRHSGGTRRQTLGLAGKSQRRTIRRLISMLSVNVSEPQIYEVGDVIGLLAMLWRSFIVLMVSQLGTASS
jgi:hypothetical protein